MVQKFMVEKSGAQKFMVEKSGVERYGVEKSGVEMSFNPNFRFWFTKRAHRRTIISEI